jgi:3-hydroxyacyl-CoA dehydrogenase
MSADYKGDVAVITMNNPPVNGLGYATRQGIDRRAGAGQCRCGRQGHRHHRRGKAFSGGADIKEFGSPKAMQEPNLLSVIRHLKTPPSPWWPPCTAWPWAAGWSWHWAATTALRARVAASRCPK